MSNDKQKTHICKWCGAETTQSDNECYARPISSIDYLIKAFQGAYGDKVIDVISIQIQQAKAMHKEEVTTFTADWSVQWKYDNGKSIIQYYNETFE